MAGDPPGSQSDVTIPDTAHLWRRIPPWEDYTVFDPQVGGLRPSSAAFDDDEMSVFIGDELSGTSEILHGLDGFGVVSISARLARDCGHVVVRDPEPHPAHALVVGPKTRAVRRRLARGAEWVLRPAGEA